MTNETLRDILEEIYATRGSLTPAIVVEEARPRTHPLHEQVFHVSRTVAAELWYLERARDLIQRVRIKYVPQDDSGPMSIRAYHSVPTDNGRVFESADRIAADPVMREIVLRQMDMEWRSFRGKYEHFQEFSELIRDALIAG